MTTAAVKVAVAHRILATELRKDPWGPTPLYLDAPAVSHGNAADQMSREMKYLAAKLIAVQEARSQGKIKTEKTNPAEILTKPLLGKGCAFKRGRIRKLRVVPPAELSSSEADRARCPPPGPAPGTGGRAPGGLLGLGRG